MPTKSSRHVESPSLDAELALTDSETESDEEAPEIHAGDHDEGQAGPNPGEQDEGQAGPNPVEQDKGQAGSNPSDAAESQPQSSHVVHARINLEHMDSEATDASTQQNLEQMDEELTTTAYPNVQENLKLLTEYQVIIEEPVSSIGTLSSLQNLDRELNFTNQLFIEKPQEEEHEKTNTESEVQSMVTVPILQDTSSVHLMTSLVIDLTVSHLVSTTIHAPLPTSIAIVTATTTTTSLPPPPPQPQQSTTDPILVRRIGELEQHMADLVQSNLALEERLDKHGSRLYKLENINIPYDLPTVDIKEILQQRMFEDKSYEAHEDHKNLFDALQKSLERDYSNQLLADLDEARKKKRKISESPRTPPGSPHSQPPPLPPPAGASGAPGNRGPSSSKTAASTHQSMPWTTSNTRYESTGFTAIQETSSLDDLMHDDSIPDEHVHLSDDEDSRNDQLPKDNASALVSTHETPAENSLLAKTGDMTTFINWYCHKVNKTVFTQADFEGQAYEVVKAFYPDVVQLQFQMEECHKMLTDQGSSPALSISKMKAASYPDFGLELLVPEQMWIDDVCTYDINVRTHMRILSVVRIKAYSRYGYDYLSEIVLRRADFQEHTIAKKDFKNLYPSDFEDLNLLLLQGHLDHLDHLPGLDKRMLSSAVKLWTWKLVI
ncbi:hypothetical protein Tco_0148892 [Tanacetum coccineum]